ncbi:MAG: hypothetical protein WD407_09265 [Rhodospirillales bacterium]
MTDKPEKPDPTKDPQFNEALEKLLKTPPNPKKGKLKSGEKTKKKSKNVS